MPWSVFIFEEVLKNDLQPVPLDVGQWNQGCAHGGIGKIVRQVFDKLEGQGGRNTLLDGIGGV